jgi:hypothetical protein
MLAGFECRVLCVNITCRSSIESYLHISGLSASKQLCAAGSGGVLRRIAGMHGRDELRKEMWPMQEGGGGCRPSHTLLTPMKRNMHAQAAEFERN